MLPKDPDDNRGGIHCYVIIIKLKAEAFVFVLYPMRTNAFSPVAWRSVVVTNFSKI